jgi:hypothetical protein
LFPEEDNFPQQNKYEIPEGIEIQNKFKYLNTKILLKQLYGFWLADPGKR